MVGYCQCMLDVQQVAQVAHKEEAVRCDDHRDAESAPPPLKQSICAVYVCGGSDTDHFGQRKVLCTIVNRWMKPGTLGGGLPSPRDVAEPPLGHRYCVVVEPVHCGEFWPAGSASPCGLLESPCQTYLDAIRRCTYLGV
jgi:hypothetical protein